MIPLSRSSLPRARSLVVTLVLIAAVSPFVVFALPEVVGADESYVVLSGSMEPTLSPGDVVIVDATATVGVGDIITYDTGDQVPTTHRVIDERDGGYQTKGDANENVDSGLVAFESVIGRTIITIPFVGYVILWANSPVGYVLLVVIPLVLLGVSELRKWARQDPTTASDTAHQSVSADNPTATVGTDGEQNFKWQTTDDVENAIAHADDIDPETQSTPTSQATASSDFHNPSSSDTGQLAIVDLKLTLLAMTVLLVYAGWNIYREVTTAAAPTPLSVGVFTAGLLGLLFTGAMTISAWQANNPDEPRLPPALPLPDGGEGEMSEESDE
ncbi:signal peptidase I [Halonotius pteroides]|uniref:Signal peptidase I n=1 Tax=Halonotius pteroides TaxID=268735 RepID=A0A3A6QL22_9EURY|nr:signal peptidase I [Halonotius pteroides]RJX48212.1 signal peptidase I [Halonotius pteroides]